MIGTDEAVREAPSANLVSQMRNRPPPPRPVSVSLPQPDHRRQLAATCAYPYQHAVGSRKGPDLGSARTLASVTRHVGNRICGSNYPGTRRAAMLSHPLGKLFRDIH